VQESNSNNNNEKKYKTIDHEVVHKFAFSSDLWHQLVEDIKAGKNPVEIWDANSHIFLELHHLE
jgi:hypothetical protein